MKAKAQVRLLIAALSALTVRMGLAAVRYVDANGATPSPPYTSWATAVSKIQDAMGAVHKWRPICLLNPISLQKTQ